MNITARRNVLLLVLIVHVAIDAVLISSVSLHDQRWIVFPWRVVGFVLMALPISQSCLIALWAATSQRPFALRLPAALVGSVFPLIVLTRMIGMPVSHPNTPVFVFVLITQLLTILILVNGGRFARRLFWTQPTGATAADTQSTQFSIWQLLLWTAILASILGVGKTIFAWCGWTANVFAIEFFYFCQIVAVGNALCTLIVWGLFAVRVRWPVRILSFPLVVAACGAVMWLATLVMSMCFAKVWASDVHFLMMLAASQIIYHTITLWPLWLCGYIGQRGHADTGPHETTPASGNTFAQ